MNRTTRHTLAAFAAVLLLAPQGALNAAESKTPRPNILIFLTDDQGYGDLGYHGNSHVKTPQLDAFAREAVELADFHVSPVCSPTRGSRERAARCGCRCCRRSKPVLPDPPYSMTLSHAKGLEGREPVC